MGQLGKNFNPEAADFNLEGVFSLGLHNLAEFIGDLSTNANKELGIEQVRTAIRRDILRSPGMINNTARRRTPTPQAG